MAESSLGRGKKYRRMYDLVQHALELDLSVWVLTFELKRDKMNRRRS